LAASAEGLSDGGVARAAASGGAALAVRQGLVHGANLLGAVALARLAGPSVFGVYAVVVFAVSVLRTLSGSGVAANVIRSRERPVPDELDALFIAQLGLALAAAVPLVIFASPISRAYGIPWPGAWLFRSAGAALVLSSFQVIPQVLLEREVRFWAVAGVEVPQALAFNAVAVAGPVLGHPVAGLAAALLVRAVVGVALAQRAQPWRPRLRGLALGPALGHLDFGFFFLASGLLSLLKDAIVPVFLAVLLGVRAAGLVTWALLMATYPLTLIMGLQRLYLPLFAALGDAPARLRSGVRAAVAASNLVVAPAAAVTLAVLPSATPVLFGARWLPALPLFYLFWVGNLLSPTTGPLMGAANSAGYARLTFAFSAGWFAATWGLGAPLIVAFGAAGFAVANLLSQGINFLFYGAVGRRLGAGLWRPAFRPWLCAASLYASARLAIAFWPSGTVIALCGAACAGLLTYFTAVAVLYPGPAGRALCAARGLAARRWR
jgi:O-antigen/teichoic acid export membrane protein